VSEQEEARTGESAGSRERNTPPARQDVPVRKRTRTIGNAVGGRRDRRQFSLVDFYPKERKVYPAPPPEVWDEIAHGKLPLDVGSGRD
jgi:hypothetical protein